MTVVGNLFLEVKGESLVVTGYAASAFRLDGGLDRRGYSGPATFIALRSDAECREVIDVSIDADLHGAVAVVKDQVDLGRLSRLVRWLTSTTVFTQVSEEEAPVIPAQRKAGSGHYAKIGGLTAAAVLLLAAISYLETERGGTIVSDMAFVSMPGETLDARSTGQLQFVKGEGELKKGELFATLKSSHGNPVFVQAGSPGTIRQVFKQRGDFVEKGEPIAIVVRGSPKPYAAVFLKQTDAIDAIAAGRAQIEVQRTGERIESRLSRANYVLKPDRVSNGDGTLLTELDIPLPQQFEARAGEPLVVRFAKPATGPVNWTQLASLWPWNAVAETSGR